MELRSGFKVYVSIRNQCFRGSVAKIEKGAVYVWVHSVESGKFFKNQLVRVSGVFGVRDLGLAHTITGPDADYEVVDSSELGLPENTSLLSNL